jgi:hypothetical protein
MNTTIAITKTDYLNRVAEGLADLSEEDRAEVIQDLEAHLTELNEGSIQSTLGTPEEFVAEFRASAGLDEKRRGGLWRSIDRMRKRLDRWSQMLAHRTNWSETRPVWIWTRGWLAVSCVAILAEETPFQDFPIPAFDGRTLIGLLWVLAATYVSVWLDRGRGRGYEIASLVGSGFALLVLVVSLGQTPGLARSGIHEDPFVPDQLYAPESGPISNIYPYDLAGNPVEVLLYDQSGNPIETLPPYYYEIGDTSGVELRYDTYGRPVTNLYPLKMKVLEDGQLAPAIPPTIGFPDVADE